MHLSVDFLSSILKYNPDTGDLIWIKKLHFNTKIGEIAGKKNKLGYLRIFIKGKYVLCHRIAWALFYGNYPYSFIDHKNGIPYDNRICNLRDCSHSENMRNRKSSKTSTSKYLGVCFEKSSGKWKSQITTNGKVINLGRYKNEVNAAKAYDRMAKIIHGDFAKINTYE